jgi:beta-lactam-binding protein with PASTA domain
MKELFKFISSRIFLINLGIALVVILGIVYFFFNWIDSYTMHGESITVPDVRGMKSEELKDFLDSKHLRYTINDSMFELDKPPRAILEQDPEPGAKVKDNRMLYLTLNAATPPPVKMPDLTDVSYRQAEAILLTFGLKVGVVTYQPDLAKNAVLKQLYRGRFIPAGEELPKGSVIDLVLGDGYGITKLDIPSLIGLSYSEALSNLRGSGLNVGQVSYDAGIRDSGNAVVYKQMPEPSDTAKISQGEAINIWLKRK